VRAAMWRPDPVRRHPKAPPVVNDDEEYGSARLISETNVFNLTNHQS
jgi:hypothetical protein